MSDVIDIRDGRPVDYTVSDLLTDVLKCNYDSAVVIGMDYDGHAALSHTILNDGDILLALEHARLKIVRRLEAYENEL